MRKILAVLLVLILSMPLSACKEARTDGVFTVAVPIAPLGTFADKVSGETCRIITVIPEGSSPETFELLPKDKITLSEADVYFTLGIPSEEKIIASLSDETEVIDLAALVSGHKEDLMYGTVRDHHTWLSPTRAEIMVYEIGEVLSSYDKANAQTYRENASSYVNEIYAAFKEAKEIIDASSKSEILVYHPAFAYFCEEFGITMYSVQKDGKEASAMRLAEMIDLAKEKGIKTIYYQSSDSKKDVEAFSEFIGGQAAVLSSLDADYTENIVRMARAIKEGE